MKTIIHAHFTELVVPSVTCSSRLRALLLILLAPFFVSCAPLSLTISAIKGSSPFSKDKALALTKNLKPFAGVSNLCCRLEITDHDGIVTDFHYVWRTKAGAAATIIFVHGYPASLFTWTEIMAPIDSSPNYAAAEALAGRFNLLALDLPGHGFTKSHRCGRALRAILEPEGAARSLLTFLDARHIEGPVILVGHSFGALVALNAAKLAAADGAVGPIRESHRDAAPNRPQRKWSVTGLMLIAAEGTPRQSTDYLPTERKLRDGFLGWASAWHRGAGIFNGLEYGGDGWEGAVEKSIRELSTNKAVVVPAVQRTAYACLIRVPENYHSNRYLVRRDKCHDWPVILWAGASFPGKRILIWGASDNLFPVAAHLDFVTALFKPSAAVQFIPNVGHITPEEAPQLISKTLIHEFGPAAQ